MNWNPFKKDKDKDKDKVEYLALPLSTLLRNIIYDSMLNDPELIAKKLGLPPVSEDVSEMEHEASTTRLEKISVLLPLVEAHAELSAQISFAGYSRVADMESLDSDTNETFLEFFKIISLASSISCLSMLADLNLIETSVVELDVNGK